MDKIQYSKSQFKGKIKAMVKLAEDLRNDTEQPRDVTLPQIVKEKFNVSMDEFYSDLGMDPSIDTLQNIFMLPDEDIRWLVPEIIRDALRMGLRTGPIYPQIIAAEEKTAGLSQVMPYLNMADAAPRRVGQAETIPLGTLSYGSKTFSIYKIGRGIRIPYEVQQYVTINVVSIFLQDFGIKLGQALDTLAIDVLINGEQSDGSESAPVIGIDNTVNGKAYKDFLRAWIRMSRLGRLPNVILGGEEAALVTLDLDEFKVKNVGTPNITLNLKTPIPSAADYHIHGAIPDNQEIIIDPRFALIKFNAQPLMIESEKIVSNQTMAFYVTITTGFAKLFRDAALIIDDSLEFSENGFPTWMDVDNHQVVEIV